MSQTQKHAVRGALTIESATVKQSRSGWVSVNDSEGSKNAPKLKSLGFVPSKEEGRWVIGPDQDMDRIHRARAQRKIKAVNKRLRKQEITRNRQKIADRLKQEDRNHKIQSENGGI